MLGCTYSTAWPMSMRKVASAPMPGVVERDEIGFAGLSGRPQRLVPLVLGYEPVSEAVVFRGGSSFRFIMAPVTAAAVVFDEGWVLLIGASTRRGFAIPRGGRPASPTRRTCLSCRRAIHSSIRLPRQASSGPASLLRRSRTPISTTRAPRVCCDRTSRCSSNAANGTMSDRRPPNERRFSFERTSTTLASQ